MEPSKIKAPKTRTLLVVNGDNMYNFFAFNRYMPEGIIRAYVAPREEKIVEIAFFISHNEYIDYSEAPEFTANTKDHRRIRQEFIEHCLDPSKMKIMKYLYKIYFNLEGQKLKGYSDLEIGVYIWRRLDKFDRLILFAQEGDYKEFIKLIQDLGKEVYVVHTDINHNQDMIDTADESFDASADFEYTRPIKRAW